MIELTGRTVSAPPTDDDERIWHGIMARSFREQDRFNPSRSLWLWGWYGRHDRADADRMLADTKEKADGPRMDVR
jgi:hypothetical protein